LRSVPGVAVAGVVAPEVTGANAAASTPPSGLVSVPPPGVGAGCWPPPPAAAAAAAATAAWNTSVYRRKTGKAHL